MLMSAAVGAAASSPSAAASSAILRAGMRPLELVLLLLTAAVRTFMGARNAVASGSSAHKAATIAKHEEEGDIFQDCAVLREKRADREGGAVAVRRNRRL